MQKPKRLSIFFAALFIAAFSVFQLFPASTYAISSDSLEPVPMRGDNPDRPEKNWISIKVLDRTHFKVTGGSTKLIGEKEYKGIVAGIYTDTDLDRVFRFSRAGAEWEFPTLDNFNNGDISMNSEQFASGGDLDYLDVLSKDDYDTLLRNVELKVIREQNSLGEYIGSDYECENAGGSTDVGFVGNDGKWQCDSKENMDLATGLYVSDMITDRENINITFRSDDGETIYSVDSKFKFVYCEEDGGGFQPEGDQCSGDSNVVIRLDKDGLKDKSLIKDVKIEEIDGDNDMEIFIAGPKHPTSGEVEEGENSESGSGEEQPETCAGKSGTSFGWIICPVVETGLKIMEFIFDKLIQPVLRLEIEDESGLRDAWSGMRFIANLFFVVAFFVVIYSAATGNILSSYDVRKLLPRIFIVAILVQLSFFLSILALDISNEAGDSIETIFNFALGSDTTIIEPGEIFGINVVDAFVEGIVSLVAIVGLFIALIYSFVGIIMLMGAFLIRDMGIVILIVVSPIAFAMAILPGTEDFFKKWWKWLFGLLAMYPIMMAFLSAGKIAASIISTAGLFVEPLDTIVAMVLLFLPFFIAPKVLMFAGVAAASLGSAFKSLNNGYNSAKNSDTGKRARDRVAAGKTFNPNGKFAALNTPMRKLGGGMGQYNVLSGTARNRRRAGAESRVNAVEAEQAKIEDARLVRELVSTPQKEQQKFLEDIASDKSASTARRMAAVNRMVIGTDFQGLGRAFDRMAAAGGSEGELYERLKQEHKGTLGTSAPHLLKTSPGQGPTDAVDSVASGVNEHDVGAMHKNGLQDLTTRASTKANAEQLLGHLAEQVQRAHDNENVSLKEGSRDLYATLQNVAATGVTTGPGSKTAGIEAKILADPILRRKFANLNLN